MPVRITRDRADDDRLGDELTPASKLSRRAIVAKYATESEGMYAGS